MKTAKSSISPFKGNNSNNESLVCLSIIVFMIMAKTAKQRKVLHYKGNNSNKKLSDNFDQGDICRPYHKDHFINWNYFFYQILFSRHWPTPAETISIHNLKGNNYSKELSNNNSLEVFVELIFYFKYLFYFLRYNKKFLTWPRWSINNNRGHAFWWFKSLNAVFVHNTIRNIRGKFHIIPLSNLRGNFLLKKKC